MQGHKLEGFDKKNGEHRVAFLFIHSEDLENGINDYFDGKLQIEPQEFIHRRNHLKSIIH